jgi:hypothetical protein
VTSVTSGACCHFFWPDLTRVLRSLGANSSLSCIVTYVTTSAGWAHRAVLIDLFSPKVLGGTVDEVIHTRLCQRVLEQACASLSLFGRGRGHCEWGCPWHLVGRWRAGGVEVGLVVVL